MFDCKLILNHPSFEKCHATKNKTKKLFRSSLLLFEINVKHIHYICDRSVYGTLYYLTTQDRKDESFSAPSFKCDILKSFLR